MRNFDDEIHKTLDIDAGRVLGDPDLRLFLSRPGYQDDESLVAMSVEN